MTACFYQSGGLSTLPCLLPQTPLTVPSVWAYPCASPNSSTSGSCLSPELYTYVQKPLDSQRHFTWVQKLHFSWFLTSLMLLLTSSLPWATLAPTSSFKPEPWVFLISLYFCQYNQVAHFWFLPPSYSPFHMSLDNALYTCYISHCPVSFPLIDLEWLNWNVNLRALKSTYSSAIEWGLHSSARYTGSFLFWVTAYVHSSSPTILPLDPMLQSCRSLKFPLLSMLLTLLRMHLDLLSSTQAPSLLGFPGHFPYLTPSVISTKCPSSLPSMTIYWILTMGQASCWELSIQSCSHRLGI